MQWFRLYDDVLDDPKVQQLKPELFKHWINLLCLASKNDPRGYLPTEWSDIAFRLRVTPAKAVAIIRELVKLELIDEGPVTFRPHGWDARQKRSDNVADRVAKHRGNVTRNVTDPLPVTDEKRDSNVLDTDTESETEQNRAENTTPPAPQGEPYTDEFQEFWKHYPKKKSKDDAWKAWKARKDRPPIGVIMASIADHIRSVDWTKDGGKYIPHPATWLRAGSWMDEVEFAPSRHQPPPGLDLPPGVTMQQLDEWVAYRNAKISLPPEREILVDRYLSALNGRAVV